MIKIIKYILLINFILLVCILIILLYKNQNIKIKDDSKIVRKYRYLSNKKINNGIYTAIIIEPREHKALEFVLENFINNLNNKWNIIVFHGNKNINYINNIIKNNIKIDKNRIKLINLNVDNLTINDYNKLLKTKSFYDNIPTEIFLIFQTDSMICSDYKDYIYKFIKYDYVGAPWINEIVGNGGLSLRKKSKMLEIIEENDLSNNKSNEDIVFSDNDDSLKQLYINKPTFEEAKEFSIEHVFSDKSFGIHKAWKFHTDENLDKINNFCPGFNDLVNLNNL